ncbi:hypothetical protein pb186bvf_013819 [Paramecium bursaria]
MNSKMFSPDQRNLGGRRLILQQMLQHLQHVGSAKSSLNSINTNPSIKDIFKKQKLLEGHQVLNTFEKRPSVEKFKNNYYIKRVTQKNVDHLKNVEQCKKRIQEMNERTDKKNKFNYTVYPSLFFRRVDKQLMIYLKDQNRINRIPKQREIDWEAISKQIPKLKDEQTFKHQIFDIIIGNRIYQDDDYAFLHRLSKNLRPIQSNFTRTREIMTFFVLFYIFSQLFICCFEQNKCSFVNLYQTIANENDPNKKIGINLFYLLYKIQKQMSEEDDQIQSDDAYSFVFRSRLNLAIVLTKFCGVQCDVFKNTNKKDYELSQEETDCISNILKFNHQGNCSTTIERTYPKFVLQVRESLNFDDNLGLKGLSEDK